MKNLINKLKIQNFKSLEKVDIDCARINIIIGKPNVGKSNALEAISLLGGIASSGNKKFLSEFVRYDKFRELFSSKGTDTPILIQSELGLAQINYFSFGDFFDFTTSPDKNTLDNFNKLDTSQKANFYQQQQRQKTAISTGHQIETFYKTIQADGSSTGSFWGSEILNPIKKFEFKRNNSGKNLYDRFLLPPNGDNLYAIVKKNKQLTKEVAGFFKEYKLKFVFKEDEKEFGLQREKNGVVFSYSYDSMADTLQRIIFNIAAIRSNKNSVLLFEEPEAHSFPYYIKLFAEEVIADKHNQYFITTHSPFILNTIIENAPLNDVKVFVATYNNYQTKLTPLTQKELEEMLNDGNDIFFSEKLNG